jgi:hypothetical protein
MSDARASHCIDPCMPRGGNAAVHLNWVASERAARRINSAASYYKANVDFSAMAACTHGDHEPVSVVSRDCRRSGTDDCESGRQNEGAYTIADHGSPYAQATARLVESRLLDVIRDFIGAVGASTACFLIVVPLSLASTTAQAILTAAVLKPSAGRRDSGASQHFRERQPARALGKAVRARAE